MCGCSWAAPAISMLLHCGDTRCSDQAVASVIGARNLSRPDQARPHRLTSGNRERMFEPMAHPTGLTEERLALLYDAKGFGGETTMRAKVVRELIDEIRLLRSELMDAETDRGPRTGP